MAAEADDADGWVTELEANEYGVRLLTLAGAYELAGRGCCAGWYISPYALRWTIGRMAASGRRYHVIADGEPLTFDTVADAHQFLSGILRVAAAPKLHIGFAAVARERAAPTL
jgi:hypothetical protein